MVDEGRQYSAWTDDECLVDGIGLVSSKTGIIAAKKVLNDLHYTLGQQKFTQVCSTKEEYPLRASYLNVNF